MPPQTKHLFGPVPSRRLGLSLGVDIVPLKTCTQNCMYCQLGVHCRQTLNRKPYVNIDLVVSELKNALNEGLKADYITLSGSGEPTLNSQLAALIDQIKQFTDIPVAILTNGTLFSDPAVRADCAKADVVLPSLDAGDDETFQKINAPHEDIDFPAFVDGLCRFRTEFTGQIWLEVFFIEGLNTQDSQIRKIKQIIQQTKPDKVHLNTSVRPPVDPAAQTVSQDRLTEIATELGPIAEVIANFAKTASTDRSTVSRTDVLELLKRRPCCLEDICSGLSAASREISSLLAELEKDNKITTETTGNKIFFKKK
ncbi:MAG: radical SAM protein [Planctomycetes bacterium]|nr:radical SAM protein [Planctomycetota bacterium]